MTSLKSALLSRFPWTTIQRSIQVEALLHRSIAPEVESHIAIAQPHEVPRPVGLVI